MNDYPAMIAAANHVEPVPRRIRAFLAGEKVFDTTHALYVWEWPNYPQYYIPLEDVRRDLMIPESHSQHSRRGTFAAHALRVSEAHRPAPPGCLPGEAEVDLAFNVGPFFGLAQPQHQFFKRCCVLGGELKPGQEVEGLSEVTPVVQPSRDCREIVKPGGDVM